jgi:hypothetical protein
MAVIPGFDRTISYYSSSLTANLHRIVDAVEGLLAGAGTAPIVATGGRRCINLLHQSNRS